MQEQDSIQNVTPRGPDPSRGRATYLARQTNYFSTPIARPGQPVAQLVSQAPTMAESVQAAQRIVQPNDYVAQSQPAPQQPVSQPTPQTEWVPPKPVNSFDFVTPKRAMPQPQTPVQPAAAPLPELAPLDMSLETPAQPRPVFQPSLPTDLVAPAPEPAAGSETSKKFKLPKLGIPHAIAGMAVLLFIAGASVAFIGFRTNKDVESQVKGISSNHEGQDSEGGLNPDGVPYEGGDPPDVKYYRTAASYPRVLRIPKIKTEARVLPLSISPTGALKAPGNTFDTGWYKDSAKPGEAGAMVIDGHKSGPTKPGVFDKLGSLKVGDKIEIERGDGETFTYTAKEVKTFDADKLDMSSVLVPYIPGKQGLNIITCAGKYNQQTKTYDQRVVVYAVL